MKNDGHDDKNDKNNIIVRGLRRARKCVSKAFLAVGRKIGSVDGGGGGGGGCGGDDGGCGGDDRGCGGDGGCEGVGEGGRRGVAMMEEKKKKEMKEKKKKVKRRLGCGKAPVALREAEVRFLLD